MRAAYIHRMQRFWGVSMGSSLLRQIQTCKHLLHHSNPPSISSSLSTLTLDSTATVPLIGRTKSREILSLLKIETDPTRIVDICLRNTTLSPESTLDRVAMSVAVSKLSESKRFDGIRTLVEDLKSRPDWRNERFLSHSIILYGQAGMLENAIATFEQMNLLGIDRTVRSLNSLLFACILAKKYAEVKKIFTEFPKMYNIKPNTETYDHAIEAFCELGESSLGYSVIAQMVTEKCEPNETTFGYLIAGFYKEGKFEDVGKVMKLMEGHGMKPGPSTYNFRIESLCKLGRSFEAKALFDGMLKRGVNPNSTTYRNLIHGFGKEGKLEDAKSLLKSMGNHGCEPDASCYFILISFLCQGGDYLSALSFSKESMKKDWFPYFSTMKSLVEGLVSISEVEEAKELVGRIKAKFPKTAHLWKQTEETLSN